MSTLDEQIERVRSDARERLAAAATADEVDALRHEVLGRSGSLTALLRELGSVPAEERPALGRLANEVRDEVESSHGFEFFQVEGLVIDRGTSLADLKGMLEEVARALYGRETRTRFRPGYYPFTEPSVAFDIGCLVCSGEGCPACKRSGWMTILGAGMVHPTVIRAGSYDPDEYQ